jgi:hypothetical protein
MLIRAIVRAELAETAAAKNNILAVLSKPMKYAVDVELISKSPKIARTITVNQQTCYGITPPPKGRTRRTIPMTSVLKRLEVVREGFVVRNLDGSQETDGQANAVILRICRRAGLSEVRPRRDP